MRCWSGKKGRILDRVGWLANMKAFSAQESVMSSFPEHYPEGCPPSTAKPVSMRLYRFVDGTDRDHQTHFDLGKAKSCNARGLSTYNSLDAAIKKKKKVAFFHHKKQIGYRDVSPSDGLVDQTGDNTAHHTWWVYEDVVVQFELVEGK